MRASIIVAHASIRGEVFLERCLTSIRKECTENDELIVAVEGTKSTARNMAAEKAKGDILIFFDDDVVLREGCLNELLQPFKNSSVGIVGGVNVAFGNIVFEEQISSMLYGSPLIMLKSAARYSPRGNVRFTNESELIACVLAVRKSCFFEAGGFPEDIVPCEENVLIQKIQNAGYLSVYNPFAVVYHRRPKIWREYAATIFSYGVGRGTMMRKLGSSASPKMVWKPNKKWLYYFAAGITHYVSYISGLIWGYFKDD